MIRVQTENPYRGDLGGGRFWFLMPDFVGTSVDSARAKLKELGFTGREVGISYVDRPDCAPSTVCETIPEGLTRTDNTSDKLFYVGRPAADAQPADPRPRANPTPAKPTDPKQPKPTNKPDDIF